MSTATATAKATDHDQTVDIEEQARQLLINAVESQQRLAQLKQAVDDLTAERTEIINGNSTEAEAAKRLKRNREQTAVAKDALELYEARNPEDTFGAQAAELSPQLAALEDMRRAEARELNDENYQLWCDREDEAEQAINFLREGWRLSDSNKNFVDWLHHTCAEYMPPKDRNAQREQLQTGLLIQPEGAEKLYLIHDQTHLLAENYHRRQHGESPLSPAARGIGGFGNEQAQLNPRYIGAPDEIKDQVYRVLTSGGPGLLVGGRQKNG